MNTPDLPETIRAFVAIHLPDEVLAALRGLQERLQSGLPRRVVRWASPGQMHMTLMFLGNVATANLSELEAGLANIGQRTFPMRLRAEGLGCFPGPARPRVIWVGLAGDLPQLVALQSEVANATQLWCERSDIRSFCPHLTIGRVKEANPRAIRQLGEQVKDTVTVALGDWQVGHLHLLRSQLSPAGAEHTILASLPLLGRTP